MNIYKSACILALAFGASYGVAQYVGPEFPPPGGVSYSGSGDSGRGGGLTWNYWNLDPTQYQNLYWGPSEAVSMSIDNNFPTTLSFDPGSSNLGAGVAVWSGTALYTSPINAWGWMNVDFVLTVSQPLSVSPIGGNTPVWAQISGTTFWSNLQFRVQDFNGSWEPLLDFVDTHSHYYGTYATSSFSGAFWHTNNVVTEPTQFFVLGAGICALAFIRRAR